MNAPEPHPGRGPHSGVALLIATIIAIAGLAVTPSPVAASWERTLTVGFLHNESVGDGHGRVTSDDGNIDCSYDAGVVTGDCSEHYIFGSFSSYYDVTLTFDPDAGNIACTNGSGGCAPAGSNAQLPIHFDLGSGGDVAVTGSFTRATYQVMVERVGPGTVTSNSTSTCTPTGNNNYCWTYKGGDTVILTAHPDTGFPFSWWLNHPCEYTDPYNEVCSFTATQQEDLRAVFGMVSLTLRRSTGGGPCEVGGDLCVTKGTSALREYRLVGTSQTFDALPDTGYVFDHWNAGPCAGKPKRCTFTLRAATELTATFKKFVAPTPTPKPTALPPAPTAGPTTVPESEVPAGTADASTMPAVTAGDVPSAPRSTAALTTGGGDVPTSQASSAPVPASNPPSTGGLDLAILALLGVILVLALAFGFALGRGRAPGRPASNK